MADQIAQLSPVEAAFLRFKGIEEGTREYKTAALNPVSLTSSFEFRCFVAGVQYGAIDGVADEDQTAMNAASHLGQPAARRLDEEVPQRSEPSGEPQRQISPGAGAESKPATVNTDSGVPETRGRKK